MRGNEIVIDVTGELQGADKFSIPMRGNEAAMQQVPGCRAAVFSIPMRGNEPLVERPVGSMRSPVFDPHEG